ncbi:MAG: CSLREA domain-containing protein [Anaerolineae bacterium]|nr:CSLREA domain-containing protein [Anaerolineae bacterium]
MRVTYLFSIVSGVFITAILLLGIFHLGSQAAPLAVFTVNSTADATDAVPGDGVCETAPGNGICTLRAAVRESNALAGADEIILPGGTYLLTIPGANENNAATGDLDIAGLLTISGAGAATTIIDANGLDRVLDIQFQGSLSLHGVTVRGGFVNGGSGGGINMLFNGNLTITDSIITENSSNAGGGVAQLGSSPQIIISNSTISGNSSVNGPGGGLFINAANLQITDSVISGNSANDGGGLTFYFGSLTMTDSVVEDNTAVTIGGGIFNGGNGLVISSTIQNNMANSNNPTLPGGGGIANAGTLTIRNSQVISNHAPNYGGGGLLNADTLILENTEVAYNNAVYGGGSLQL